MQNHTPLIMNFEGCNNKIDDIIETVRRQASELYSPNGTQPYPAGPVIVHGNITLAGLTYKYEDLSDHVTGNGSDGDTDESAVDEQVTSLKLPGLRYAFLGKVCSNLQ